jgi:hypothetical protein
MSGDGSRDGEDTFPARARARWSEQTRGRAIASRAAAAAPPYPALTATMDSKTRYWRMASPLILLFISKLDTYGFRKALIWCDCPPR